MTPPINIDGTDITGATIDGQDVEQITIDGQDVLSAILDISMFDNPIYHFHAGSSSASYGTTADFPEVLDDSVPDATPSDSPTLKQNYESTGYNMFEYEDSAGNNESGNDQHDVSPDAEYSSDPDSDGNKQLSVFALCYPLDIQSDYQTVFGSGSGAGVVYEDGRHSFINFNGNSLGDGPQNATANVLDTIGFTYDESRSEEVEVFGSGNSQETGSTTFTLDGTGVVIGNIGGRTRHFDGGIAEVVVCTGVESLSNYQSYHNNRV